MTVIVSRAAATAIAAFMLLGTPGATHAKEDWQLGHGPFLSVSDVRNHNRMPLDINDVTTALEGETPDWGEALRHYAFGGNFPNHSLALFADDYNGRFASHLPVSTQYFGTTGFQRDTLYAALIGTGKYRRAEPAERVALVEAGLEAVALNWSRYELGESQRKGTAAEPNWSLENGSPKNWNEIFAFWHGPDGQHSVYAALEARDGGAAINEELYQVLADGQEVLVTDTWTPNHAEQVNAAFDKAATLLMADALAALAEADDAALPAARGRAAGYWLAAAETLADDKPTADAIEAALAPDADTATITTALELTRPTPMD